MKTYIKMYAAAVSCATVLATCATYGQVGGSVTVGVPGANVTVSSGAVAPNYVYYPAYGVYYNSARHQYGWKHGDSWVWGATPPGVSLDVLRAAPSVRMDWHDSPARHHTDVVKRYPKDWRPDNHRSLATDKGR